MNFEFPSLDYGAVLSQLAIEHKFTLKYNLLKELFTKNQNTCVTFEIVSEKKDSDLGLD